MRPHPECSDTDPEARAGVPVGDGWDGWTVIPCDDAHPGRSCAEYERELDRIEAAGEVADGR